MKFLFICTENLQRSPTAESLFKNHEDHEAKSVGISESAEKRVNSNTIKWADKIFVMEAFHKNFIIKNFPESENKIIILDIPDVYFRDDPELVDILKENLGKFLN